MTEQQAVRLMHAWLNQHNPLADVARFQERRIAWLKEQRKPLYKTIDLCDQAVKEIVAEVKANKRKDPRQTAEDREMVRKRRETATRQLVKLDRDLDETQRRRDDLVYAGIDYANLNSAQALAAAKNGLPPHIYNNHFKQANRAVGGYSAYVTNIAFREGVIKALRRKALQLKDGRLQP